MYLLSENQLGIGVRAVATLRGLACCQGRRGTELIHQLSPAQQGSQLTNAKGTEHMTEHLIDHINRLLLPLMNTTQHRRQRQGRQPTRSDSSRSWAACTAPKTPPRMTWSCQALPWLLTALAVEVGAAPHVEGCRQTRDHKRRTHCDRCRDIRQKLCCDMLRDKAVHIAEGAPAWEQPAGAARTELRQCRPGSGAPASLLP